MPLTIFHYAFCTSYVNLLKFRPLNDNIATYDIIWINGQYGWNALAWQVVNVWLAASLLIWKGCGKCALHQCCDDIFCPDSIWVAILQVLINDYFDFLFLKKNKKFVILLTAASEKMQPPLFSRWGIYSISSYRGYKVICTEVDNNYSPVSVLNFFLVFLER